MVDRWTVRLLPSASIEAWHKEPVPRVGYLYSDVSVISQSVSWILKNPDFQICFLKSKWALRKKLISFSTFLSRRPSFWKIGNLERLIVSLTNNWSRMGSTSRGHLKVIWGSFKPYPWILEKNPKSGNIQERHSWEKIQGKYLPMVTSRAWNIYGIGPIGRIPLIVLRCKKNISNDRCITSPESLQEKIFWIFFPKIRSGIFPK